MNLQSRNWEILDFYLMDRGIKVNPNKYGVPSKWKYQKKEIMKINGMLTKINNDDIKSFKT